MVEQNIKVLRKTLGLSQAAFGEKLGVSRDVIGNIEYGRVKPKDVFLNHICAVFNVRGEWLRTGAGDVFDADERLSRDVKEAVSLFSSLNPKLQKYALQQLKGLLEVQRAESGDGRD